MKYACMRQSVADETYKRCNSRVSRSSHHKSFAEQRTKKCNTDKAKNKSATREKEKERKEPGKAFAVGVGAVHVPVFTCKIHARTINIEQKH